MSEQEVTIKVPYPEEGIYARPNRSSLESVQQEQQTPYPFEKVVYPAEGGILLYCEGLLHPYKFFPNPPALDAVNLAKRILISQVRLLAKNWLWLLSMLRVRNIENWIIEYNTITKLVLDPFFLKPRYYTPCAREVAFFVSEFLSALGVHRGHAYSFGKRVALAIHEDVAYRYRIEDLASETTAELMRQDPRGQILKLLRILKERDPRATMFTRFAAISTVLRFALLVPRIRRAFNRALAHVQFADLQMDEIDRYHTLKYSDYMFGGRTLEDRLAELVKLHNGDVPAPAIIMN